MGELSLRKMGASVLTGNCSFDATQISGLPVGKSNYIIYAVWGTAGDNIVTNRTAFAAFIGSTKCRIYGSADAGAVVENVTSSILTLNAAAGTVTSNKNFETTSGIAYKYIAW